MLLYNMDKPLQRLGFNDNLFTADVLSNVWITDFSQMDFGGINPEIHIKNEGGVFRYTITCDSPTKIYFSKPIVDNAISIVMNIPSTVTDMSYMMESSVTSVKSLKSLQFTSVDTSNVTTFECAFLGCGGLTSIDVSKFDTSSCTNFYRMFMGCDHMLGIDCSGFDTSKGENFDGMFDSLGAETNTTISINVNGWNTSSAKYMTDLFSNTLVDELDLSHFDTSNVEEMAGMFFFCSRLAKLNISNFNLNSIVDTSILEDMFNYTNSLTLANVDMSNCDNTTKTLLTNLFNNRITA